VELRWTDGGTWSLNQRRVRCGTEVVVVVAAAALIDGCSFALAVAAVAMVVMVVFAVSVAANAVI
jgi:hypothetical protein